MSLLSLFRRFELLPTRRPGERNQHLKKKYSLTIFVNIRWYKTKNIHMISLPTGLKINFDTDQSFNINVFWCTMPAMWLLSLLLTEMAGVDWSFGAIFILTSRLPRHRSGTTCNGGGESSAVLPLCQTVSGNTWGKWNDIFRLNRANRNGCCHFKLFYRIP